MPLQDCQKSDNMSVRHNIGQMERRVYEMKEMKMKRRTAIKVTLSQMNCCRGTVQPRKWQLTGNNCSTAVQAVAAHSPR